MRSLFLIAALALCTPAMAAPICVPADVAHRVIGRELGFRADVSKVPLSDTQAVKGWLEARALPGYDADRFVAAELPDGQMYVFGTRGDRFCEGPVALLTDDLRRELFAHVVERRRRRA